MRAPVCSLLVLFLALGAHGLLRVQLKRIQLPDINAFRNHVNNLRYHNTGPRFLKDYGYVQYVGEIGVGTPEQKFNVLFDTATPALWIPWKKFISDQSSTFVNLSDCQVSRPYTNGYFKALDKKDVVEIGGAIVKDQAFELFRLDFEDLVFDGIFGLSYPSPSPVCGPEVVPVQNMADQGIAPAVFSFRYNKDERNPAPKIPGEVIFGIDKDYVDEASLEYIQLTEKANWQIKLDRVNTYRGIAVCTEGCQAIIDSASPLIIGPTEEVYQLYVHLTGGCGNVNGSYQITCQNIPQLPSLVFTINGKDYEVEPEDYVLKFPSQYGPTCISTLVGMDLPDKKWILGDSFLKSFYSVFDQEKGKVAFGELKRDYDENDFRENNNEYIHW